MVYQTYESPIPLFFWEAKKYDLALHQKEDGYKETYNKYKWEEQSIS